MVRSILAQGDVPAFAVVGRRGTVKGTVAGDPRESGGFRLILQGAQTIAAFAGNAVGAFVEAGRLSFKGGEDKIAYIALPVQPVGPAQDGAVAL